MCPHLCCAIKSQRIAKIAAITMNQEVTLITTPIGESMDSKDLKKMSDAIAWWNWNVDYHTFLKIMDVKDTSERRDYWIQLNELHACIRYMPPSWLMMVLNQPCQQIREVVK